MGRGVCESLTRERKLKTRTPPHLGSLCGTTSSTVQSEVPSYLLSHARFGKKTPGGAGTHTGHTRDTRAHKGTRMCTDTRTAEKAPTLTVVKVVPVAPPTEIAALSSCPYESEFRLVTARAAGRAYARQHQAAACSRRRAAASERDPASLAGARRRLHARFAGAAICGRRR